MDLTATRFKAAAAACTQFQRRTRAERMQWFLDTMGIRGGERVIDLGGTATFWDRVPVPLEVTVVNLPGTLPDRVPPSRHKITMVEGDATDMSGVPDGTYDIAFSNSVIEHVGDARKRAAMAQETRRLAPRYWVQTPSIWFPIEAHTYMPFWWFYPESVRQRIMRRWTERLPEWSEMIRGTTVLREDEIRSLFPEARLRTERVMGLPKSYVAYHA